METDSIYGNVMNDLIIKKVTIDVDDLMKEGSMADHRTLAEKKADMRSLFYDVHRTVMNTVERGGYSVSRILSMLGISRSWYYSQISFSPVLDRRFNPMAIRNGDEWLVI